MSANDRQEGGNHYKKHGVHQPWDVLRSWLTPEEYRGWLKGNMIVYLARERDKDGILNISKTVHFGEKFLEVFADELKKEGAGEIVLMGKGGGNGGGESYSVGPEDFGGTDYP